MKFKAFLTENGVMLLERRFLPMLDKMGKVCASKWNERECAGIAIKELYGSAQDEEADAATALFVVASITIDVYSLINCPKIECNKVLSKGNYSIARVCIIIIFRLIS
ncbi:hypothetical protein LINPERPRIM_LOCUS14475 [Linum perenne]